MRQLSGPVVTQVERVARLPMQRFLDEYVAHRRPVVITGALDKSPMMEWTFAWFRQRYGDRQVPVTGQSFNEQTMKLSDYLDIVAKDNKPELYMQQFELENFPEACALVDRSYRSKDSPLEKVFLWLGPSNTFLPFHQDNHSAFDIAHNTFMQIRGRKHWWLVPPEYAHCMHLPARDINAPEQGGYWKTEIDPRKVNLAKYPRFAEAPVQETVLGPGEILFVPGSTFHAVHALDQSISAGFWWPSSRVVEVALAPGPHHAKLTMTDIEKFGGVARLCENWQPDGIAVNRRQNVLAHMDPATIAEIDRYRLAHGQGTLAQDCR